jgi:biotin-dependent carboxylase-like uncharacterized protein
MNTASLRVVAAGPLVTFQDGGRLGHLRHGIPASGPMDRTAHAIANVVLGNPAAATAVEVSRAGASFECVGASLTVAVVGGRFRISVNGAAVGPDIVVTLVPGDQLVVAAGPSGSWTYLAVAGELAASQWFGHTATHSLSGLGGGHVAAGLDVEVSAARADPLVDGPVVVFPGNGLVDGAVRVVLGPQDHRFTAEALHQFVTVPFALTEGFDRMGVRLDGPRLDLDAALSIPSEPIVRGSVQVAGDGVATVLLADHQTTGGYPKIATVVGADLDAFCQLRPGDSVRFVSVTPAQTIVIARARASAFEKFLDRDLLATRRLARRLADTDLIGDVGTDTLD